MRGRGRALVGAVALACTLAGAAACRSTPDQAPPDGSASGGPSATPAHSPGSSPAGTASPGPLQAPLLPADLLVQSQEPLPPRVVRAINRLDGVEHVEPLSVAQVGIENRVINVAAVDPGSYRRYTPRGSAQHTEVWQRVAGGELAIDPTLGERLQDPEGYLKLGNDEDAARVHIGAFAAQVPQVDAVVSTEWGEELGMPAGNALLVSVERLLAPQRVRPRIRRIVGAEGSVQILGPDLDVTAVQTAVLAGGSVAEAVGTFSYRVLGGGRIAPDRAWESEHVRTEEVPILGAVRCHKVMLPQLRAALTEVQRSGLAAEINPREYAGCYYPRFIAGTTQLSLHSFGIAVDLNVPGNQRGTDGEMDRRVVAIFKKWGFAWGGDWAWTDPMHFEMNQLVEVR